MMTVESHLHIQCWLSSEPFVRVCLLPTEAIRSLGTTTGPILLEKRGQDTKKDVGEAVDKTSSAASLGSWCCGTPHHHLAPPPPCVLSLMHRIEEAPGYDSLGYALLACSCLALLGPSVSTGSILLC